MTCVTSPTYSLSLNGSSFGFFHGKRGLRQGDPLSPLLFTLCMEYLSRILKVVGQQNDFKFHPLCGHIKLNHLLFADDLLLFSKGNAVSIMWILRAFATFSAASGLCLNKDKSEIFFNGVHSQTIGDILQVSGFREFPMGGQDSYYRAPAVSWDRCCISKKEGGLGIKDPKTWNKALFGKYVWWIASKKDHLWVKWINHVYMKGTHWTSYSPPNDCRWSWKQIAHTMETFKAAYVSDNWLGTSANYTPKEGYIWLRPSHPQVLTAIFVMMSLKIICISSTNVISVIVKQAIRDVSKRFWSRNKSAINSNEDAWLQRLKTL
ncbi:uncharacterized protein LOC141588373 [Silene latifolia]|uniref:uncharacterized protein LOC141588373 n=1 Tax=Silene latifolia TaxID=37657 RepID=UPI003D775AFE